jgi:hypothetical protein
MARNHKVAGAKMTKHIDNVEPFEMTREETKAYYRAHGQPLRDLCHARPSFRRFKKAHKKVDVGRDGAGCFERKVISEELRDRIAYVDQQLMSYM